MKRFAVGWLSLCLVAILFPLVMTSGGSVMFESLRSSAVGRAALTAVALSRECVRVYSPRPLRKVVRWWVRLPFGDFFALLVKRRAQRSSRLEEETMQKTPIVSYDRFMTRRRWVHHPWCHHHCHSNNYFHVCFCPDNVESDGNRVAIVIDFLIS